MHQTPRQELWLSNMAAKFQQIKKHILTKIESGEWQENDPVPSENKLAEDFSVSRMTARRALEELNQQGLLIRTKGSGTFVASLKNQGSMFEIRDIADEIKERGHTHQAIQIQLEQVIASTSIAIALDVAIDSPIAHSIIVHQENGKPVQLEERFVNPKLAPEYLSQDFKQTSPHEYLTQVAPLTEAQHTIEAIAPNAQVCEWLQLTNQEPCLQLTRKTSSKNGVVCFAQIIYPGSSYRLSGHLTFKNT
ncbi:MAG: GntR family histidine utilization transcriptional repressor [Psychrosphaera sp.]|jgi:GntR family histidine utilization transcriptional repressor